MLNDFLEIEDIYKALFSISAGIILGLERELKDKKAGLKTISIICLGATLFALISKKVGGDANAGQIAAYIVSGVGFIGAGAIFKDGSTISGLTTAGIIWLAAAVGTSIGFGEYFMASIFLLGSFIAIILVPFIAVYFTTKKESKQISVVFNNNNIENNFNFISLAKNSCSLIDVKRYTSKNGQLEVIYDIMILSENIDKLYSDLQKENSIHSFSIV
jgi:putative Mg2+ transporter-C (MgtC) family protein